MPDQPQVERREAQPYVALARTVTMDSLASAVDQGFPEILRWLATHGAQPAAAPFIRYASVDADGALEIELGVPVAADVTGDDHVRAGTLPAGDYVTLAAHRPVRRPGRGQRGATGLGTRARRHLGAGR